MIDSNATDDNDEKIEIIFKTMSKTINHLKQIDELRKFISYFLKVGCLCMDVAAFRRVLRRARPL